ncbi:hypothetical protein ACFVAV_15940 [Nocardia sp. NPDC057663]|uniref:hypothetical protein n=1 Tax=Nocardia sp. NPDC057663 TaxID=3346201 RepID=UPI00366F0B0A
MTAHRPAQIMRLSATVIAGAASLCLTVAAGAYIVNHMPELAPQQADRGAPAVTPGHGHHPPLAGDSSPRFTGDIVELAVSTERVVPTATRTVATQQFGAGATPDNSTLAGQLRIGTAYVGAQVAPARTDTIAFTVDTNLVTTLASKYLGVTVDPAGVTALRTELDTRRGELVFVLSDPGLGSHTLRVERVQKPSTDVRNGTEPAADATPAPQSPDDEAPTTVDV